MSVKIPGWVDVGPGDALGGYWRQGPEWEAGDQVMSDGMWRKVLAIDVCREHFDRLTSAGGGVTEQTLW